MKPYIYTAQSAVAKSALVEWTFESYSPSKTVVLPDGCRDIIVRHCASKNSAWHLSTLCHESFPVVTSQHSTISGMRLRPGMSVKLTQLSSWLHGRDPTELFNTDQLDEFCFISDNLTDALNCLASGNGTVLSVATDLGVSLRSLQRLVKSETGQTPQFWFSLARIRKAGRALLNCDSLSDTAIDAGFSDQAHMNREMKKWFGKTPKQIMSDREVLDTLFESGYG